MSPISSYRMHPATMASLCQQNGLQDFPGIASSRQTLGRAIANPA
ncbi:hypothetical protein [Leptolyngbya sp. CCY15150]|nr:hypothetical protein [Leptolyngbya sp. CCY15150]